MISSRTYVGAGGLLRANKTLIDDKSDLNNIEDGWYFYCNGSNPANCAQYSDNSLVLQISYSGVRKVKFQLTFSENARAIFFRLKENDGIWTPWKEVVRIAREVQI